MNCAFLGRVRDGNSPLLLLIRHMTGRTVKCADLSVNFCAKIAPCGDSGRIQEHRRLLGDLHWFSVNHHGQGCDPFIISYAYELTDLALALTLFADRMVV